MYGFEDVSLEIERRQNQTEVVISQVSQCNVIVISNTPITYQGAVADLFLNVTVTCRKITLEKCRHVQTYIHVKQLLPRM